MTDFGGDSAYYMLLARQLSPFWPAAPVLRPLVEGTVFPPLFPLVIGIAGGGFLAAHLVVAAALLGSVACLYHWLRLEGAGVAISAAAAGLFALMPGTYLQALNIWTENPYLLLSLLAIVSAHQAARGNRRAWWGLAVAVAASTVLRSAALPLLAAFVALLASRRPARWPLLLAAGLVPLVIWTAWSRAHQSGMSGYLGQLSAVYGQHPLTALAAQVRSESFAILGAWRWCWLGNGGAPALDGVVLAAAALCLAGWLRRLVRREFDAFYLGLYLGLLLVWPYPGEAHRLSYVVVPVLLGQGVLEAVSIARRLPQRRAGLAPGLLLAVLAIVELPSLVFTVHRFLAPAPAGLDAARHTQDWYEPSAAQGVELGRAYTAIIGDLHQLGERVPEGDCITAVSAPVVMLYSGRASYTPPPADEDGFAFDKEMERCRYVYLLPVVSAHFRKPFYPEQRLEGRAQTVSEALLPRGDGMVTLAKLLWLPPSR